MGMKYGMLRVPQFVLLIGAIGSESALAANLADFSDYSLRTPQGQVVLPGRLFVPPEVIADPTSPRPLIVFLHGGGASGTDNVTQVSHTPDFLLDESKRRGAFLYVPQTANHWTSAATIDAVMTMIDRVVTEQRADADRLYATGFSNGGGGTWNLLSRNSGRFAAAVAVSGVLPAPEFDAANLLGTAIFAIHARDDATVPVARSRAVVDGILAAAGEPLPTYPTAASSQYVLVSNPSLGFHREFAATAPPGSTTNFFISGNDLDLLYFEQPVGGHAGMAGAFYFPPLYDWLFDHTLSVPEPSTLLLAAGSLSPFGWRRRRTAVAAAGALAPFG